jgi:hypothetical protein
MIDLTIFLLIFSTAIFLAIFSLGLNNVVDGLFHKCWHKWEPWEDPHNTGVHVVQLRTCKKCNITEHRIVVQNAKIQLLDEVKK